MSKNVRYLMSYTIDKYYHSLIKNNRNSIKAIQQNDKRVIQELYYDNRDYFLNWAAKENHISFEDAKDLKEKVTEINKNWSKYEPMVESAYNKVIEKYNTKYIFEKIKNKEEIK